MLTPKRTFAYELHKLYGDYLVESFRSFWREARGRENRLDMEGLNESDSIRRLHTACAKELPWR